MDVFVNNTRIAIFDGANVKDALEQYSVLAKFQFDIEKIKVYDEQNHLISLKGELSPGNKLTVFSS